MSVKWCRGWENGCLSHSKTSVPVNQLCMGKYVAVLSGKGLCALCNELLHFMDAFKDLMGRVVLMYLGYWEEELNSFADRYSFWCEIFVYFHKHMDYQIIFLVI